MSARSDYVLNITDLTVSFLVSGRRAAVVQEVGLRVPRGRFVALVGESGCGKSVTALSILRLLPEPPARVEAGVIRFCPGKDVRGTAEVVDLLQLRDRAMRRVRGGGIAMVFQEPLTSLNPVMSAGEQIAEAIRLHQSLTSRGVRQAILNLLADVGISDPARVAAAYPHELSGGQRQRVMIAMALGCEPELLIADEPTTALDVTVQAQFLDLLQSLQQTRALSVLLITHDLGVVARVAEEVYVMYAGRIVEHAATQAVLTRPVHPYTAGLLACTPRVTAWRHERMPVIEGSVPSPADRPSGCAFHPRCPLTRELAAENGADTIEIDAPLGLRVLRACTTTSAPSDSIRPHLRAIADGHHVACDKVLI